MDGASQHGQGRSHAAYESQLVVGQKASRRLDCRSETSSVLTLKDVNTMTKSAHTPPNKAATGQGQTVSKHPGNDNAALVPQMTLTSTALEALIFGNPDVDGPDNVGPISDDQMIEAFVTELPPSTEGGPPHRVLEPDAFVDWFAAINVFKLSASFSQTDPAEAAKRVASGNSRSNPTAWLYHCGIGSCVFKTWSTVDMDRHLVVCKGAPVPETPWHSEWEGCNKSFSTENSLQSHESIVHKWTPRPCSHCPDKQDVIYEDKNALKRHAAAEHDELEEASVCPLHDENCTRPDFLYTRAAPLLLHLTQVHKRTRQEGGALLPPQKQYASTRYQKPKASYECPVEGCMYLEPAQNRNQVRSHLTRFHKFTKARVLELVPLARRPNRSWDTEQTPVETPKWCPVSDCASKGIFAQTHKKRQHLRDVHKWTDEAILAFLPLTGIALAKARKRSQQKAVEGGSGKV